jgi:uncharacterized NAD-dependent epimerase/dehydratase family protein
MIDLPRPYLLFLGDITDATYCKTAFGLRDWAGELCVGEYALPEATVTTGLPKMTPAEAYDAGARGLVIGVASRGGRILPQWEPSLIEGLEAGLDIISGMHSSIDETPLLKDAVVRTGRRYIDVRRPPASLPIATGQKRSGKRLLTVGTDCALGKKYTALALTKAFVDAGVDADFRASGQTGIMIAGSGIPIDAVIADFVAGAAELLSPASDPAHWDVIEGQGSLFHPSYAGVSLGLLHGSQPDVIILCHEVGRNEVAGLSDYPLPSIVEAIEVHLLMARRTNPNARCGGVSLNTAKLSESEAEKSMTALEKEIGLPVADPIRGGPAFAKLVQACLA